MHRVMIRPATYETAHEAVEQTFEIFPCDLKDKKVLIKPNVLRTSEPDEAIATHPAAALAMVDDLPQVDSERCVTCFCCQEICPEKAMTLE